MNKKLWQVRQQIHVVQYADNRRDEQIQTNKTLKKIEGVIVILKKFKFKEEKLERDKTQISEWDLFNIIDS